MMLNFLAHNWHLLQMLTQIISKLKNKLIILPGVKNVVIKDGKEIKESFLKIFKDSSIGQILEEDEIEYTKYAIHFERGITHKSIKLIKSYIIKILASNEVIFSRVEGLEVKNAKFKRDLKFSYFFYLCLGVVFFIWMIIFQRMNICLKKIAYIFQRFQRKKNIDRKVSLLLFAGNITMSLGISYSFFKSKFFWWEPVVLAIFIFSLFQIKEYKWKES